MDNKFESMLEANQITHGILNDCKNLILTREEITEKEVETFVELSLTRSGLEASFRGAHGYPSCICISVNDAVIHGLPSDRKIVKGDVVGLDFGVIVNGFYADAAITFINGKPKIPNKKTKLIKATKEALDKSIEALQSTFPNCKVSDIVKVIASYNDDYGVVEGFGGHGIGDVLHDPAIFIPNSFHDCREDQDLNIGDYFTIEPMFTLGDKALEIADDEWTMRTVDGSIGAHFEYSLTITKEGVIVLK